MAAKPAASKRFSRHNHITQGIRSARREVGGEYWLIDHMNFRNWRKEKWLSPRLLLAPLMLAGAPMADGSAAFMRPAHNTLVKKPVSPACVSQNRVAPHPSPEISTRRTLLSLSQTSKLSAADQERLLLGDVGLTAFIVAEMQHFVNETVVEFDQGLRFDTRWTMPLEDKLHMGLATTKTTKADSHDSIILEEAYVAASSNMTAAEAVDIICNITETAFLDGLRQPGLLSALGSAIMYFRDFYRTPLGIAACERIGLSDYTVSHHITDMYHHRTFRGAYTKTLPASGKGEIAAALAVGLPPPVVAKEHSQSTTDSQDGSNSNKQDIQDREEDDECLLWSPTNPDVCIHWKSEDEAWRKTRFERIQMEGTKDPRRGGSGTTR